MDTGCPSVLKTGRKSNPDCAYAKLRGGVIAPNGVPDDRGSCTEEPCEIERLTHGFEVGVGTERSLPTITYTVACLKGHVLKRFSKHTPPKSLQEGDWLNETKIETLHGEYNQADKTLSRRH